MFDRIPVPCEECGHREFGLHYYVIKALVHKIARDNGEYLPRIGYVGDRTDEIVFQALVDMIASNTGVGFHNVDQGHPVYAVGSDDAADAETWGDGPEHNGLFQTLQQFDHKYHATIQDLSSWQKFCAFAFKAYRQRNP